MLGGKDGEMNDLRSVRTENVIICECLRGSGTDLDIFRLVVQVYHPDGTFIAENDPACPPDQNRKMPFAPPSPAPSSAPKGEPK